MVYKHQRRDGAATRRALAPAAPDLGGAADRASIVPAPANPLACERARTDGH
ncbi:MAG: hypothetical protein QOG59_2399 [Solirubrobacteraceae bacterium]|nr:hypothetical protein [Solirubrobacteraceae bacterium]